MAWNSPYLRIFHLFRSTTINLALKMNLSGDGIRVEAMYAGSRISTARQEVSQNSSGQTGNGVKNTWSDRKLGREHKARQETREITQPDWKPDVLMCYRNSAITWSDRESDRDVLTAQEVSQRSNGIQVNTRVLEDRAHKAQEAVR